MTITSTPTPTSTSTLSTTQTPSPSFVALVNGISAGAKGTEPAGPPSSVSIAVGSCIGGMVLVVVAMTIRSHLNRRRALTTRWAPHGKPHSNRMNPGPTLEISHNPAVQSWRQSSSHNPSLTAAMSVRRIDRKTFGPVTIDTR